MDVLFVCSECNPFIKTGGLADVIGALPNVLIQQNVNSSVVLPLYKRIKNKYDLELIQTKYITFNNVDKYIGIYKSTLNNVDYYFIDNEEFFNFDELYGMHNDAERFIFFNMAVIESLSIINKYIDIIHINDWQTGLIPFLLKNKYNINIKTVFTIHNIQYQGIFDLSYCSYFNCFDSSVEFDGKLNFMKAAIMNSSIITTVSKTYRDETLTSEYGYGLENILKYRQNDYFGIINGINTLLFNPNNDKYIYHQYSKYDEKFHNKLSFCTEYNINTNLLCGVISRLCDQKGIDLIINSLEEILQHTTMNFFFLGSGDKYYEDKILEYSSIYPTRIKSYIGYDEKLSSKLYASCDLLLVPSKFEPCGLTQMIAMKYGTIPLVRETGGLVDSVEPFNKFSKLGCGFSFKNYSTYDLKQVIYLANNTFGTTDWEMLAHNAMKKDFSFYQSSSEYIKIYNKLGEY